MPQQVQDSKPSSFSFPIPTNGMRLGRDSPATISDWYCTICRRATGRREIGVSLACRIESMNVALESLQQ